MDRKQRIDHYLQRLTDKGFEIYDVRRELEQQNVDEEEIKIIVRAVDDELQARLLKSANPDYAGVFIRIGIILILIGIALGLAMVVGVVEPGDLFIFVYASFFGGLSVLLFGLFKRKKADVDNTPDPSKGQTGRSRFSFRKISMNSGNNF